MNQNRTLKQKILFVLAMLLLYKIGTHIPVPGINSDLLKGLRDGGGVLGFANSLSGGALSNFSIFAVGIMPYITASIIIQLLAMDVVPSLSQWAKEGERGQKKTKKVTRYFTVILAVVQSFAMTYGFSRMYPGLVPDDKWTTYAIITFFLTLGTVILMFMGEAIDKKGIGNGISILIFAGIISVVPKDIVMYYMSEFQGANTEMFLSIIKTVLIVVIFATLIIGIVFIHGSERRIPIMHPKGYVSATKENFIPLKLNSAGVIPVIFSIAFISTPTTIVQFVGSVDTRFWVEKYLSLQSYGGMALYVTFIILFSYFYAFVQVNPEKVADNLKKTPAFIPSVKIGKDTENYLSYVLKRITLVGSLFLAFIAVMPMILTKISGLPTQIQIGGTSLIIVVSVVLDLYTKIKTEVLQMKYKKMIQKPQNNALFKRSTGQ